MALHPLVIDLEGWPVTVVGGGGGVEEGAAAFCADGCTLEPDADLFCEDASDDAGDGKLCTWSDNAGAGSINWQASHSGTFSCTDKGTYALQLGYSGGGATYVAWDNGSETNSLYGVIYFNITAESISAGENVWIVKGLDEAGPSSSFTIGVQDVSGTLRAYTEYRDAGSWPSATASSHSITVGAWYRLRFSFVDESNFSAWIADQDGSNEEQFVNDSLSNSRSVRHIYLGTGDNADAAATIQIDNTKFDDDTMPGYCGS